MHKPENQKINLGFHNPAEQEQPDWRGIMDNLQTIELVREIVITSKTFIELSEEDKQKVLNVLISERQPVTSWSIAPIPTDEDIARIIANYKTKRNQASKSYMSPDSFRLQQMILQEQQEEDKTK